ncbi:MAG: hypothetical protein Q9174_001377, partial [Haloplaca sp. 1 TL-2023]
MTRGNYRGRAHHRGHTNDHMMVDHDSNQRLHGHSNYQHSDEFSRRGRGWRGGPDDRGRGLQIRGRGRGNFKHNEDSYADHHHAPHDLVKIAVKGVLESNVNNAHDDGLSAVRKWLETRANFGYNKPIDYVYLKNPRWEYDDMVFEVDRSDAQRILQSDGQLFHNVLMSVKRAHYQHRDDRAPHLIGAGDSMKTELFQNILDKGYDATTRMLMLNNLGTDSQIQRGGTWNPAATRQKPTDLFQGLVHFCEKKNIFPSRAVKAEKVESISLSNNELTNVAPILEVAKAFPDVRNLDLSNNRLENLEALKLLRGKLKRLDWLIISPNPIDINEPNHARTIIDWFPTLRKLNMTQVRNEEEAARASRKDALPMHTIKDNFQDEGGIAEATIRKLLLGMDNDRPGLAKTLYDDNSTFSISFNPSAPRSGDTPAADWGPHLKQSRNLSKVVQLHPRIQRLRRGIKEIEQALQLLPPTQHPDLDNERMKYSFDCMSVPGIPSPQGPSSGVGGLKVDIRGSFEELHKTTGVKIATRSFDRTLILGPGIGHFPVRIVSDMLMLRAYGGHEAFQSEVDVTPKPPVSTANVVPIIACGVQSEEEARKAAIATEVSKVTGLKLEWSAALLGESGWDAQVAFERFKDAKIKGTLK